MTKKVSRIHSMDLLRAVAMYLGIVLHCAIVYQCEPRAGWPKDSFCHPWFDFYYQYVHAFRMQLFFLVAGYFARLLFFKIGLRPFVEHRTKRIVLPLVVSIILITPLSSLSFNYYYALQGGFSSFDSWGIAMDRAIGWNGLYHLWFLYYLLLFYGLMLLFVKVRIPAYLTKLFTRIQVGYGFIQLLAVMIPLFLIVHFLYEGSIEAWVGITPRVNQLLYYGLFFFVGYLIHTSERALWRGANNCWYYLLFGSVVSVSLFIYREQLSATSLFVELLVTMQTIFLVFGFLGLFTRYFNFESTLVRYLSDASYWFYLIHFPLVTILQVLLLTADLSVHIKFLAILTAVSIVSLFSYHYFVRHSFIGYILNGKR